MRHSTAARVIVVSLAAALAACAGRYGSIRHDARVGREFEQARPLPGHRYWVIGPELAPEALLALRNDRPLRSPLWREVPAEPASIARFVDRMREGRSDGPFGAVVLDERGERIGAWLSYLRSSVVRLLDDGGVVVAPPMPETEGSPVRGGPGGN